MEHRTVRIEIVLAWSFVLALILISQISGEMWGINLECLPLVGVGVASVFTARMRNY